MESAGTQSIKATLEEDKPWFKTEFKKWEKEVAALPAEDQVQAVRKRLMESNPGFDGKLGEEIVYGVVTTVSPFNDHLLDISPLRAFSKLKSLRLLPSAEPFITQLADLSPLAGMALTSLDCSGTKVPDLSPFAGMSLTTLKFDWTQVSDLAPLKGMQLTSLSLLQYEGQPPVQFDWDASEEPDMLRHANIRPFAVGRDEVDGFVVRAHANIRSLAAQRNAARRAGHRRDAGFRFVAAQGNEIDDPQYPRYEGEHAFAIERVADNELHLQQQSNIRPVAAQRNGFDAVGPFRHERIRPFAARRDAAFDLGLSRL